MPVTYEVNDGLASVLIVDDKPQMREVLQKILVAEGYAVETAAGADDALERIDHSAFDIVLTDLRMPGRDGFELLDHIRERAPEIIVILMTAFGSIDTAVEAIKRGAMDYVSKPFETNEVLLRIRRALQERGLIRRVAALERQVSSQEAARAIIGNSGATERLRRVIQQVAPLDATVLITGETGTGKELVARALHESSPRAKRPFIALDCSALPESLVESELFGHERGAFTGAVEMRVGLFEAAEDGTLFLDEVDSLTLSVQAKLLRALQERVVRRLGGKRVVPVRARIVAAANRDLEAMIESGAFRQDLYFRLAAIPIVTPPLRERRDDVPQLIAHFMTHLRRSGQPLPSFSPEAMERLLAHRWPGNVRELENAVHYILAFGQPRITPDDLPAAIANGLRGGAGPTTANRTFSPRSLADVEKEHILRTLSYAEGNQAQAAKLLGIDRRTLYAKLRTWGLSDIPAPE
jgi:two-component system NtrC family response regulator